MIKKQKKKPKSRKGMIKQEMGLRKIIERLEGNSWENDYQQHTIPIFENVTIKSMNLHSWYAQITIKSEFEANKLLYHQCFTNHVVFALFSSMFISIIPTKKKNPLAQWAVSSRKIRWQWEKLGRKGDSLTADIDPRKSEAGARISTIHGGGILVAWVKN